MTPQMERALKRQITSRFFVSSLSITLGYIGMLAQSTYHYRLTNAPDSLLPWFANAVLLLLSVAALLDTVFNDILGTDWHFPINGRFRHIVWGGMAATYVGYALIISKRDSEGAVAVFFALFGLFCATIAALDARYEIKRGSRCSEPHSTHSTS
jgi:hypothetical protein